METFASQPLLPPGGKASPDQPRDPELARTGGLADRLRVATAAEHRQVEAALGLPDAIQGIGDYRDWLGRFRALHVPLGRRLRTFPDWPSFGLDLEARCPVARLDRDLRRLGTDPAGLGEAPARALPTLDRFAQALGALYVIEGSTLGGRVILRDLERRLGPGIAGATAFFGGHGPATGALWQALRGALDRFAVQRPEEVVAGAARTFRAFGAWMPPPGR